MKKIAVIFAAFCALAWAVAQPAMAGVIVPPAAPPPVGIGVNTPWTVTCEGNSICQDGYWDSISSANAGGWSGNQGYGAISELGKMILFSQGRLAQRCNVVAGTNRSACGDYGYPSQPLGTINTDEGTNLFPALQAAGYCPQVIVGTALLENSINHEESTATMDAELATWIGTHKAVCPGVILMIATPHPDGRNIGDSTALANWQTMVQHVLALDDNKSIFAVNISAANPVTTNTCPPNGSSVPLPGVGYQSTSSSSIPLAGWAFLYATSDSLALQTGIHPRQNAASLVGRALALTFTCRIAPSLTVAPQIIQSYNTALTGSVAIGSNHATGFTPTGISVPVAPTGTASTITYSVSNPGPYTLTWVPDAGTPQDSFRSRMAPMAPPSPLPIQESAYAVVQIVSGAENIGQIAPNAQVVTGCGSTYIEMEPNGPISSPSVLAQLYNNGDVLYFRTNPLPIPAGCTRTSGDYVDILFNTNETNSGDQSGGFTVKVLAQGIVPYYGPQPFFGPPAVTQSSAASPTAPASTSAYKMQGLAGTITPLVSGTVAIDVCGTLAASSTTINDGINLQISIGSGSAPSNAGTLAGTQIGQIVTYTNPATVTAADVHVPFCHSAIATGLSVGTAYWIDEAAESVTSASDTKLTAVNIRAMELR